MDNKRFDITSEGKGDFDFAMRIAMSAWNKTIGYRVHENHLVLYWTERKEISILPYAMDADETIAFAWGWLQRAKPSTQEPDHDGDNERGFRVFSEAWGEVFNQYEAFVAITPIWAMYGK